MRCLVTGGAGFIGGHLTFWLHQAGHDVTTIDTKVRELPGLPASVPHIIGDIGFFDYSTLPQMDWVFNLAGLADVLPSIDNPLAYHWSNAHGAACVVDYCIKSGVKKLVHASTTWVYGIVGGEPTPETAPIHVPNPYALTKYIGEQYVMGLGAGVYKLPATALRLTAVFGPGMRSQAYGSVFKVFLAQKANNVPYTLVGDGSQRRDYIFVSDVVAAFLAAAASDAATGQVFNVSTGKTVAVKDIINALGDSNGITHLPDRPGEPAVTCFDNSKIVKTLGWRPKVSFEQGMEIMKGCIEEWKEEPVWDSKKIQAATSHWNSAMGS